MGKEDTIKEVKAEQKEPEEVRRLKQANKDFEEIIVKLRDESDIKNMFIVKLNKDCIALKLELGRKLTLNEIEFLKKSCT